MPQRFLGIPNSVVSHRSSRVLRCLNQQRVAGVDEQQRQAVEHKGSSLLIVAGKKKKKTAVLTRRIAYLMQHRGVGPHQILAITFTNKAAREMRERVGQLVGPIAERMWVATFHSTCVRILRQHAQLVDGLNTNFSIYDGDDARRLLSMIAKEISERDLESQKRVAHTCCGGFCCGNDEKPFRDHRRRSLCRVSAPFARGQCRGF